MFLRSSAMTVLLSLTISAQSFRQIADTCISPKGTPCRTLVYESSGWANRSWGFHAVERYVDRTTAAVRSDGATLLRIVHRSFQYHLMPSVNYDRTRIVTPAQRRTVEFDNTLKQVRDLGGVWNFSDFWTGEVDCSDRAALAGDNRRRTRDNLTIAGVRAIEYLYETPDHRFVQRIAFAPSLGCTAVEYSLSKRSAAGLRISEDHRKLVAVTIGEPEDLLFAIPAGYRHVPSDAPWPYVWMGSFPGHITTTGFSRIVP